MKKSLLSAAAEAEIIERILRVHSDSKAKWGTMNATEMIYHCNLCNQQVLEEVCDYKKPSLVIRLKKLIVFHVLPRIPKNNKGPARTHTKGRIDDEQFELQLKIYVDLIHRLVNHQQPFCLRHPALGFLTMKEWGFILWMHMDHHLRQFGV